MKAKFLYALLLSASALEMADDQMTKADDPADEGLSSILSSALAGAKPGVINEPKQSKNDKENDKQITEGKTRNYKFHWEYACAFTKWIPSNQFMHAGKTYDAKSMTLERFGFIGMNKKCFWGMVGVEWLTPLKVSQIKPGTAKPEPPKAKKPHGKMAQSGFLSKAQINAISKDLFGDKKKFKLLYSGEKHGWKQKDIKARAYGKGPTITIFQTAGGATFGGYADMSLGMDPNGKPQIKKSKSFNWFFKDGKAVMIPHVKGKPEIVTRHGWMIDWWWGINFMPDCNKNFGSKIAVDGKGYKLPAGAKNRIDAGKMMVHYPNKGTTISGNWVKFKCKSVETYKVY